MGKAPCRISILISVCFIDSGLPVIWLSSQSQSLRVPAISDKDPGGFSDNLVKLLPIDKKCLPFKLEISSKLKMVRIKWISDSFYTHWESHLRSSIERSQDVKLKIAWQVNSLCYQCHYYNQREIKEKYSSMWTWIIKVIISVSNIKRSRMIKIKSLTLTSVMEFELSSPRRKQPTKAPENNLHLESG